MDPFESYLTWYSNKNLRKRGSLPAATTMRTKRLYLSTISKSSGYTDEVSLATALADRDSVNTLLDTLSARMSPGTLRQSFYVLKSFGEYAKVKGLIPSVALLPEDLPGAGPGKPITIYSAAEMELFITAARFQSLRWWAFLSFLAETGRRAGETLGLRWEWLRYDTPMYFELPTTKNSDPQYIPLTPRLVGEVFTPANIEALKTEKHGRGWSKPQAEYPFPWTYSTVYMMFKRFCEKHGLPNRGFHNFRHTVITNRIARGVPIQAVASLAGHRSPTVTLARYSHATALDYSKWLEVDPN